MLENFRWLKSGRLDLVNRSMIMPLLRWCSGSTSDLVWCQEVNKRLFFVDKNIILGLIYIGMKDRNPYIKYPKASKEKENRLFEFKKSLVKKYYHWSEQEFERNTKMLDYIDWNDVAEALGCDRSECKMLGINIITKRPKKLAGESPAKKTLFDF